MAEYIEREVTCEDCIHYATCIFHHHGDENKKCVHFKNKADVVEVRHGEWNDNIIGFCNVCMECGAIVERTAIKNKSGELNYCPNCGAKMDGVTDTNVGGKMDGKGDEQ